MLQYLVFAEGAGEEVSQVRSLQRFEDQHLTSGKKRIDDLEGWILRGCSDENHGSVFNCAQKCILLRLVEPVDFINEKNRCSFAGPEH